MYKIALKILTFLICSSSNCITPINFILMERKIWIISIKICLFKRKIKYAFVCLITKNRFNSCIGYVRATNETEVFFDEKRLYQFFISLINILSRMMLNKIFAQATLIANLSINLSGKFKTFRIHLNKKFQYNTFRLALLKCIKLQNYVFLP